MSELKIVQNGKTIIVNDDKVSIDGFVVHYFNEDHQVDQWLTIPNSFCIGICVGVLGSFALHLIT